MSEISGISGSIPPLVVYPSRDVKSSLPATEWEACLDSWLLSLEYRLRLPATQFRNFGFSHESSGVDFLLSLFDAYPEHDKSSSLQQKERLLLKRAYLLSRRLLLETSYPLDCANDKLTTFITLASRTFNSVADWKVTLRKLWATNKTQLTAAVEEWRRNISASMAASSESPAVVENLRRFNAFVKVSADAGLVLMTGSDYLELLIEIYSSKSNAPSASVLRKALTEHIFYSLRSLMSDGSQHPSLLLDHLYFLRSESERLSKANPSLPTLGSSLVCSTSFLRHLAADDAINSNKRGQGLIDSLGVYRQYNLQLHPPVTPRKRPSAKGKAKAKALPEEHMHMHKASQISQIHDLFPDLPNGYIMALLDHFGDDTEAVIAALLEPDSLPPHLQDAAEYQGPSMDIDGPSHNLAPHSTPPLLPHRRNVFDGDDFDQLRISPNRLHKGRKEIKMDQSGSKEHSRSKAAIMAALAAFDSDDDERDDTYDVADVGGTVDSTLDTDDRPRTNAQSDANPHEESLFRAWKANEEMFARDSKTRVTKVRQDLKRETGMSDEQIEGWAIMLKKDSKLQSRLDEKYSAGQSFQGSQPLLPATRWQGDTPEDSEESEQAVGGRRVGQAQIRGNRSWGRGRGGSTAGTSGDQASTQAARKRKEQGKGRGGANHQRREGRARKVGRGMAGAPGP
ncbi:hypothetical protein PV10_00255 [Exophiala mesophila]|uniref:CUE domain-containing protein n=1 Tax=Exophiala mesophila TaxID=212818 RepID=A0A0D1ZQX6_EXOME|nr:uncharacterized protein PV10_00255 [Exophiala mesophila]KIV96374.1 hypothetical protein PV10_00255 [Exophiala mesophila]